MKVQYQRHKTHSYQHDFQIPSHKNLVYDAQAQIQNISCPGQQHAGREQKLVYLRCFPTTH